MSIFMARNTMEDRGKILTYLIYFKKPPNQKTQASACFG